MRQGLPTDWAAARRREHASFASPLSLCRPRSPHLQRGAVGSHGILIDISLLHKREGVLLLISVFRRCSGRTLAANGDMSSNEERERARLARGSIHGGGMLRAGRAQSSVHELRGRRPWLDPGGQRATVLGRVHGPSASLLWGALGGF